MSDNIFSQLFGTVDHPFLKDIVWAQPNLMGDAVMFYHKCGKETFVNAHYPGAADIAKSIISSRTFDRMFNHDDLAVIIDFKYIIDLTVIEHQLIVGLKGLTPITIHCNEESLLTNLKHYAHYKIQKSGKARLLRICSELLPKKVTPIH